MLLAISAGNSNLHLGVARDGRLVATRRVATNPAATPDELDILLAGLLALDHVDLGNVHRIAFASSVPTVAAAIEAVADRRGIPCLVAEPGTLPMPVHVDRPGEVGPDRLVDAFAAARLHGTPAVVVDCGTATTVNAVDAAGAFVGGAIAPGLRLGLDALAAGTARLPRVEADPQEIAIGRDTAAAIRAGTVLGHRILIEGLVARTRTELAAAGDGAPGRIVAILTGGLSALPWARTVEGIDVIDPDLALRGLIAFDDAVAEGEGPTPDRPRIEAASGGGRPKPGVVVTVTPGTTAVVAGSASAPRSAPAREDPR